MPRSFDACVIDLTAQGVDRDRARRACAVAFWQQHGMMPEEADENGLETEGNLAPSASATVAQMQQPGRGLAGVFNCGPMEIPQAGLWSAFEDDCEDRCFRQVRMLAPGTLIDANGNEFTWTEDQVADYVSNFRADDHPPIVLDHELSARATVGRIRSLRVDREQGELRLFGLWEFLGKENVKPVRDGRWSRTSGRFGLGENRESQLVIEGSVVWRGAYDRGFGNRAQILGPQQKGKALMSMPIKTAQAQQAPATEQAENQAQAQVAQNPEALLQAIEALREELAELKKAAVKPAPAAAVAETSVQQAESEIVAALKTQVAELAKEVSETKRLSVLRENTEAVLGLIRDGKSLPEMQEKELAVLNSLPSEAKAGYLELRRQLPNAWPAGGRQSFVVAQAPGGSKVAALQQEEAELAKQAAELGLIPSKTAQAGQ